MQHPPPSPHIRMGHLLRSLALPWLLLLCSASAWAQPGAPVVLEGLKRYQPDYLLSLMGSDEAEAVDREQILLDLQQLRNLPGVRTANYRLDTLEEGVQVVFTIEERLTLLPILGLGSVRNNIWYQLGAVDLNFWGRGHEFSAYYLNMDRRHNGSLFYRARRLGGSPWGFSVGLLRLASVEPLFFDAGTVFYNYDNLSAGFTGIYQFSNFFSVELGGTAFVETYAKNDRHEGQVTPGPEGLRQPKYLSKAIAYLNHLRYDGIYLSGYDLYSQVQSVYNPGDLSWFHVVQSDGRFFWRPYGWGNLAVRLRLGLSTNHDSPFAPFVLDSYVNIRGVGNRVDRGTGTAILNLEFRQTIFELNNIALQGVVFSDLGSWRKPGGGFDDLVNPDIFRHFGGIGTRLLYKPVFNAIFRIDYGINLLDPAERGFVLGLGQYF